MQSNSLHQLLHSLTAAEKRYMRLKLAAQRPGKENNLIRLMDMVMEMDEWDGEALKRAVAGSRLADKLAETKYQLYGTVLRHLQAFHANRNLESKLQNKLLQVDVLFEKGHFLQCKDLLNKVWKVAEREELFLHKLGIISRFRKLIQVFALPPDSVTHWAEQEQLAWRQLENLNAYSRLHLVTQAQVFKVEYVRCQADLDSLNELFSAPMLHDPEAPLSLSAKVYFLKLRTTYYRAAVRFEELMESSGHLLDLLEAQPVLMDRHQGLYIEALQDHFMAACFYFHIPEAISAVRRLQNLQPNSRVNSEKWFFTLHSIYLNMSVYFGAFEHGVAIKAKLLRDMKARGLSLSSSRQLFFNFNFAHAHLGAGQTREALDHLEEILRHGSAFAHMNFFGIVHILHLVLHFERGNQEALPSVLRSSYRYLLGRKRVFGLEKTLMKFLRKQLSLEPPPLDQAFQDLRRELQALKQMHFEAMSLRFFDVIAWLDSRITGRPFKEIVQEKVSAEEYRSLVALVDGVV